MDELILTLKENPSLKAKIGRLVDISKSVKGKTIDEAEGALIPEVRGLGLELLGLWCGEKEEHDVTEAHELSEYKKHDKKK